MSGVTPSATSDLHRALDVLRRRWLVIVAPTAVLAAVALVASLLRSPSYLSFAVVEVAPIDDVVAASTERHELDDQELATQAQILRSEVVASEVIDRLNLDVSVAELLEHTHTNRVGSARLLQVIVNGTEPESVADRAGAFSEAYLEVRTEQVAERVEVIRAQLQQRLAALEERLASVEAGGDAEAEAISAEIAEVVADLAVLPSEIEPEDVGRIVRSAQVPTEPSSGRIGDDVPLAAVLGLLLGLAAVVLLERRDRRVRDEVGALEQTGVAAALGRVPCPRVHGGDAAPPLAVVDAPAGPAAEALRRVHATLRALPQTAGSAVVLVTAPGHGEDAAGLAASLAVVAARAGEDVVLVDGDLRTSTVTTWFGLVGQPGLADALAAGTTPDPVPVTAGPDTTLGVVPAGSVTDASTDRLGSPRLAQVVAGRGPGTLEVIVAPPVTVVADALRFAPHADLVILPVGIGGTRVEDLFRATEALRETIGRSLGLVFGATCAHTHAGNQ